MSVGDVGEYEENVGEVGEIPEICRKNLEKLLKSLDSK